VPVHPSASNCDRQLGCEIQRTADKDVHCIIVVTERLPAVCAVIPPFHSAVDQAITYLDPTRGLVGVTDFYVSAKFDLPLRQMSWARRFFWRCAGCTIAAAAMSRLLDCCIQHV
jgi:hypothetical protein